MRNENMNVMQRMLLEVLWTLARLFAMLPYWVKYYIVENFVFFLLYYCLRYRMKVVKTNLRNSFPEKSDSELLVIRRKFYRTLAEIFVDTINMAHKDPDKALKMLIVRNFEEHVSRVHGRDWIAMTAHFGCWEYCSYWGFYDRSQMTVGIYHPLRSVIMENLYMRLRNNDNAMTVPMRESMRFYLRNREKGVEGKNLVMGLIADQNPPLRPDSHWFRFLNQDTIFFDGGEKLALRCNLPVYFLNVKRLSRGRYEMEFEQIYDGVEQVAPNEITERYIRKLEAMIRKRPELWMWSHRRWKHRRPDVNC